MKAFIFQASSLIVPVDSPDSETGIGIDYEIIDSCFSYIDKTDRFSISELDGRGEIHAIFLPECDLPDGWKAVNIRQAMSLIGGDNMAGASGPIGRILRSYHIGQWRRDSLFCGSCGKPNMDAKNESVARQCSSCGRLEFPRISPAIIVLVRNEKDEALLARNYKFAGKMYSLIAGFNEPGEGLEDTVEREIREEVNIGVKDIRYIKSQPWPFPNSLMLGFTALHKEGDLQPDGKEIEDAQWFSRDNIPQIPGYGSVSRYLIDLWLNRKL